MRKAGRAFYAAFCVILLLAGLAVLFLPYIAETDLRPVDRRILGNDGIILGAMGVCGLVYISRSVKSAAPKMGKRWAVIVAASQVVFLIGTALKVMLTIRPGGAGDPSLLAGFAIQFLALAGMAPALKFRRDGKRKNGTVEKDRDARGHR